MKTLMLTAITLALMCTLVHASSTIYDGVIQKVETIPETRSKNTGRVKSPEDVKVVIRVLCSPYSSESVHSWIMTYHDGDYRPQVRRLRDFKSWFIDEIPVTREQMAKAVKPGMRMTTFENRANWYFFRLETRNTGSRMGDLESFKDGVAIISGPQHGYRAGRVIPGTGGHGGRRVDENGATRFTDEAYPPFKYEIAVSSDVQVISPDGAVAGIEKLGEVIGKPVFYQPERKVQRVELIPPGYGDWKTLLVDNKRFLGDRKELEFSSLNVMLSKHFENRKVKTKRPDSPDADHLSPAKVFDAYLIAGWREPGPITIPIYHKGEWNLVDGYFSNHYNFRHLLLQPGRQVVATSRRGRLTPDALAYSSEMPAAWGTITKIEGDMITVEAPVIEGAPISGVQQIQITEDAEFVHLGVATDREKALKVGSLIKVFAPHPARFYLDRTKSSK